MLSAAASSCHPIPPKWERWSALLIICVFLIFNLVTYIDYPEVWCDEIWFSEPAVNAVKYGSFTTMVYQFQPAGTFPAINCPLYLISLIPWLSITGTTVLAIRSFNYFLMAIAAALAWIVAWRFGLVKKPGHRLLMVVLLHLGYGMSFAYRCSRPDIIGLVCQLLLLLSLTLKRRGPRDVCIAFFSAVSVWIGLQVALFAGFAAAAGWLVLRRPSIRELFLIASSMALSAGLMLLFFKEQGVLPNFLLLTLGILGKHYAHAHVSLPAKVSKILYNSFISYIDDFTVTVLTLGLALVLILFWKRLNSRARRIVIFCAILIFATPVLFNVIGHFAFYYSYVRFVPAVFAFFVVWSALSDMQMSGELSSSPLVTSLFAGTLALAMAVGLPMRLVLTAMTAHIVPRKDIQRTIASHVRANDVALCDYAYFFETKRITKNVYDRMCSPVIEPLFIPGRDLTDEQKRSVSVLIIRPNEQKLLMDYFGGHWSAESEAFGDTFDPGWLGRLPVVGKRFEHYLNQRQTERYQLQIFRRASEGAAAPP